MALYKYLEHEGVKYPVRISNSVLGEYQEETGKIELKTMTFRDVRILMGHSLIEGHEFADKEFKLKPRDVKLMVDNPKTVENFLLLIPYFFPAPKDKQQTEEGEDEGMGKQQESANEASKM